jgi:hypothetical protein
MENEVVSIVNSESTLQGTLQVQEITGTDLVPLSYALRYSVWSKEVQLAERVQKEGLIHDEHDSHARHWGVLSDTGALVASARMCVLLTRTTSLRLISTLSSKFLPQWRPSTALLSITVFEVANSLGV